MNPINLDCSTLNFRQIVELADDIVLVTESSPLDSPGTRIIYANKAFENLTGYSVEEVIGQTPRILQGPQTCRETLDRIKVALLKGEPVREVILNYTKSGGQYWLDMNINPIRDHLGIVTHFVAIERDVTASYDETIQLRKAATNAMTRLLMVNTELACQNNAKAQVQAELILANEELSVMNEEKDRRAGVLVVANVELAKNKKISDEGWKLSFYDPLTGLPNRRLLSDRLKQIIATSKRTSRYVALMMLDLDHFKSVNDHHGHAAGDRLLIEVSQRLSDCVRELDTVARLGGDEFVVVLGELDLEYKKSLELAVAIAEKIRFEVSQPSLLDKPWPDSDGANIDYQCTVSIGLLVFLNHPRSQEQLLELADAAMYQTKASGRDGIHCCPMDAGGAII